MLRPTRSSVEDSRIYDNKKDNNPFINPLNSPGMSSGIDEADNTTKDLTNEVINQKEVEHSARVEDNAKESTAKPMMMTNANDNYNHIISSGIRNARTSTSTEEIKEIGEDDRDREGLGGERNSAEPRTSHQKDNSDSNQVGEDKKR